MSDSCTSFRAALERRLVGRPSQAELTELSWHAHLLSCTDCRALLEAEEALEILLATLPDPKLPAHLAARVLSRLQLDALLELDRDVAVSAGLASRVLAGVRENAAEGRLDALLDLDRDVAIPAGLAERTLARLRLARRRRLVPRWVLAAAAVLVAAIAGWILWTRGRETTRRAELVAQAEVAPDPQMLAALDVLEEWDLVTKDDVDVLLSTLGPEGEALLEYSAPEPKGSDK